MEAETETKKPCFIPVTERMPTKKALYIVICDQWGGYIHRFAVYYPDQKRFADRDGLWDITDHVTDWMDIPERQEDPEKIKKELENENI